MQLFRHHWPRTYPTKSAQVKRLQWMLAYCRMKKFDHLAALIEQQIKELT